MLLKKLKIQQYGVNSGAMEEYVGPVPIVFALVINTMISREWGKKEKIVTITSARTSMLICDTDIS